ncbi:TonB-dependent receptor [Flavobacterium sp.]|uniref:TonB-dependent receptor domain-containing protein n=1 Tax=Flavobacterium sp. TaxID=239 RepID=UPI002625D317|nr:TonB-dependent receptor [Flavobacterium sp.]
MKIRFTFLAFILSLNVFCQEETTVKKDSTAVMETEQLKEVIVEKKKKAVERRADRTIFDFSEQAYLNSGSLMEGLKKLPGLIVSDVAGMLYQGKQLQVFMDGRPLNIYSNELNAYLEGMPASAIEKVEVITNPGAEFPATSGGAIINIITSKKAQKYLSATYSGGYSFTNYDDTRHRFNNSMTLSAANKLFSWQVQAGQSYGESFSRSNFQDADVVLSNNFSDRYNHFYYLKTGLKFDFKKDRLLVNYDITTSDNNAYITAFGEGFATDDKSMTGSLYHDLMLTYQKRFDDPFRKLDIRFNFNDNSNGNDLNSRLTENPVLNNNSNQNFYQLRADYSQEIPFLDKSKISAGTLADLLDFETESFDVINLDYTRSTLAAYTEFQANYKKFEFILGGRLESYDIEGNTDTDELLPFSQVRFFPNATAQYNFMPQVNINANYNKKIRLPDTAALNPNNTSYQNPNVTFFGNPNLQPTIYHNFEVQLNAFEYFFINYSVTDAQNQIISRIINTPDGAASVSENLDKLTIRNFNFGIPLPYMLFTKGLAETLKMDFNPDEINFLYIYAGNQKHIIPSVDTKSVWNFNLTSQLVLPKKIKFTANYTASNTGGNYYYYNVRKPLYQQVDLTFSRKFLSDNLSVSVYANDIFNTNHQYFGITDTNLLYDNKYDSRRIGISLNYKIPSKNKLAKEEGNILTNEKKQQDNDLIGN